MSFERFRTRALDLASLPRYTGPIYRGPGRNRYNRPRRFNPNLDLNEQGSANEQIAAAEAAAAAEGEGSEGGGRRGRAPGPKGMDAQRAQVNRQRRVALPSVGIESAGLAGVPIDETMRLAQIARGEAPEQLEAQQRQMQREQLRDVEERRNRNRASFEVSGKLRRGIIDGTFKNEAKDDQPPMYRLPDTMQGALTSLMSGFTPQLDENGKIIPVYARLGTTQGGNPAYEFFQGDQPMINNGVPAKLPVNAMNAQADIWDFQMSEQAGFGPTRRKARQEEMDIDKTKAAAIRDLAEASYARRGKPKAVSTAMTPRDRQKALLDNQKVYADLLEQLSFYDPEERPAPPELIALKEQLEQQMSQLGRATGQAVPIQAAPAATQAGPDIGTVVGGFRYIGGDPNNRASWEAI